MQYEYIDASTQECVYTASVRSFTLAPAHLILSKDIAMSQRVEEGVGNLPSCSSNTHLQWLSLYNEE